MILKWLRKDDPKLTPIPVRAWSALLLMAFAVMIACHPTLHPALAASSSLLLVFAAGIRYWVTSVATDHDLQRVRNEIVYVGSSTNISVGDAAWVIGFAHLAFIMAFLYSALGVLVARFHPDQLKLPIWLALIVVWVWFGSAPIGAFFGGKMGRSLCIRWRKRLQADPSTAETTRILNLIAFAITLVAGALQLLNVFS